MLAAPFPIIFTARPQLNGLSKKQPLLSNNGVAYLGMGGRRNTLLIIQSQE